MYKSTTDTSNIITRGHRNNGSTNGAPFGLMNSSSRLSEVRTRPTQAASLMNSFQINTEMEMDSWDSQFRLPPISRREDPEDFSLTREEVIAEYGGVLSGLVEGSDLRDSLRTTVGRVVSDIITGAVGSYWERRLNDRSFIRFWNNYQIHIFNKPRIEINWRDIEENMVEHIIGCISPYEVAAGMVTIGRGFGWLPHDDEQVVVAAAREAPTETVAAARETPVERDGEGGQGGESDAALMEELLRLANKQEENEYWNDRNEIEDGENNR